jgi:hypothetical protein
MLRYSLKKLLLAIIVMALFCAALAGPSYYWAETLRLFTLLGVLAAIVVSLLGSGATRAFAVGFAVFGGVGLYLVAGSADWTGANKAFPLFDLLLDWLHTSIHGNSPRTPPPFVGSSLDKLDAGTHAINQYLEQREYFFRVGHLFLALLFGVLGGIVGAICHSRSQSTRTE